jgi:hypothetical protein
VVRDGDRLDGRGSGGDAPAVAGARGRLVSRDMAVSYARGVLVRVSHYRKVSMMDFSPSTKKNKEKESSLRSGSAKALIPAPSEAR